MSILDSYVRRALVLLASGCYDIIWLEKEAFPWLPYQLEKIFLCGRVPYVVDYDDAVFHRYDLHDSGIVRRLLAGKIERIMAGAALVTAGNDYIAERARQAGAKRIEIVPTVVDLSRYQVRHLDDNATFTIGWIGTPATRKYLDSVRPALADLCRNAKARVVLVGAGDVHWPEVPVEVKPWTEETEAEEIGRFDVGIMPLIDGPWERGKCGYKLIQYMACGKSVVGSPVGVNREMIIEGHNGFLATTVNQWLDALTKLREDREVCRRMGRNGRKLVEERYNLHYSAAKLASLLREVAVSGKQAVQ